MDLLAPCRSCLQCLPFFHVSPPSSPRASAAPSSSSLPAPDASAAASVDASQSSENLPPLTAGSASQEQDVCLSTKVEDEHPSVKSDKDEALYEHVYSTVTECEAVPASGIIIAPPVSSPPSGVCLPEDEEVSKATTLPEQPMQIPFINDIGLSAPGSRPSQSSTTPVPFGAGYPAGQYPPDQIYQDQHLGHTHSHHIHETAQHGHEHSHHAHTHSHDGHVPQHKHEHSAPEYEVLPPRPPFDSSQGTHEPHENASHHHSHGSTFVDDVTKPVTEHTSPDVGLYDKMEDISPTSHLEASQSTPDLDTEAKAGSEVGDTNGTAALLESYHSEPVVDPQDEDYEAQDEVTGHSESHPAGRHHRRHHFKEHFKGLKQQIKQGGHHLKEEGSKHMQTIIENINKQAQQVEQSGSFFSVPRAISN